MGNDFHNVQQMLAQLATYIVLFIPLYHASKTFKFISTSPFSNVDIGFFSQNITDCSRVEPYNICNEYIVDPCITVSTIPDSTNINVQDQIVPTHEFLSLLQKKNNERLVFDDVMYILKKIQMNDLIYSLLEVLVWVKPSH